MSIEAQTMKLKVGNVLMSDAAQKIDFTLDNFHVDGSGLSYVALATFSQGLGRGFTFKVGGMPAGAEAMYKPQSNTFLFPTAKYGENAFQRMTILHECVHALRDAYGERLLMPGGPVKTFSLAEEAAAYLAGALFYIDENPNSATTLPNFVQQIQVFREAHTLALSVRGRRGTTVTSSESQALKDAIKNNPAYAAIKANPNLMYRNNGVSL